MKLQNGFATHFQASPLISTRTESLALLQSCRSVDVDAWCKRTLMADLWFPSRSLTNYLAKSCRKLHEKEENWTERGCERQKFYYVDPPLLRSISQWFSGGSTEANKATHSGFETQRGRDQKSETGLSVAPHKTYVLQNMDISGLMSSCLPKILKKETKKDRDKIWMPTPPFGQFSLFQRRIIKIWPPWIPGSVSAIDDLKLTSGMAIDLISSTSLSVMTS